MADKKDYKEIIDGFIYDFPICEIYYLSPGDIIFSNKVRYICEHECQHYKKSWACPPAIDSIESCIEKCRSFEHVFMFTSVAEVPDCMDFDACLAAKREHERLTLELRKKFEEHFGKVLALSTGCMICDECSYPDAPCRHPEERISTVESHGIMIMETASRLGATLDCGNNAVTYLSLIFFSA